MINYVLIATSMIALSACTPQNETYYRTHPHALQKALTHCSQVGSSTPECEKLGRMAKEMNALAYALQSNPQAFGQKIISLQNQLAEKTHQSSPSSIDIQQITDQLNMHLAVVSWLESPER